jgi:hypothetical protein
MNHGKIGLMALLLLTVSAPAGAFVTTSEFIHKCAAPDKTEPRAECLLYISGFRDALGLAEVRHKPPIICMPKYLSQIEIAEVLTRFVRAQPAPQNTLLESSPPSAALWISLKDNYPCKSSN